MYVNLNLKESRNKMFSYFKNKKINRRRSEYVDDVKIFIQVHFVRERSGERYKYNTLSIKTDPERDACQSWYEQHNNPVSFYDIVNIYSNEKNINFNSIVSAYNLERNVLTTESLHSISKGDAVCICLGLKLNFSESKALLKTAGHALTNSSESDLTIRYCLENKIYDYNDISYLLSNICNTTLQELY